MTYLLLLTTIEKQLVKIRLSVFFNLHIQKKQIYLGQRQGEQLHARTLKVHNLCIHIFATFLHMENVCLSLIEIGEHPNKYCPCILLVMTSLHFRNNERGYTGDATLETICNCKNLRRHMKVCAKFKHYINGNPV